MMKEKSLTGFVYIVEVPIGHLIKNADDTLCDPPFHVVKVGSASKMKGSPKPRPYANLANRLCGDSTQSLKAVWAPAGIDLKVGNQRDLLDALNTHLETNLTAADLRREERKRVSNRTMPLECFSCATAEAFVRNYLFNDEQRREETENIVGLVTTFNTSQNTAPDTERLVRSLLGLPFSSSVLSHLQGLDSGLTEYVIVTDKMFRRMKLCFDAKKGGMSLNEFVEKAPISLCIQKNVRLLFNRVECQLAVFTEEDFAEEECEPTTKKIEATTMTAATAATAATTDHDGGDDDHTSQ